MSVRLPRAVLLLAVLTSLPATALAGARRACTSATCVEIRPSAHDVTVQEVSVYNKTAKELAPFEFTVETTCAGGLAQSRTYHLAEPLEPKRWRALPMADPVCVGTTAAPTSVLVHDLPVQPAPVATAPESITPEPVRRRGAMVAEDPCWIWPVCICPGAGSSCNLGGGDLGGSDCGDGGDGVFVIFIALALALLALLLAAAIIVVGAVVGWATGWTAAKVFERKPLEWWKSVLLMEAPLTLGVVTALVLGALGGAGTFALAARQEAWAPPAAAAVMVATGVGAGALVATGAAAGLASVVGATYLAAEPLEEPVAAEVDQAVRTVEAVEVP
ncbi:MAG: hypothetical protein HY904_12490 [Deltaproteobacteria bacterium]|nr:hypothetical protein [Deltaproteobacteria bacterium]